MTISTNFQSFACINCGWCCQRTPCPLAIYKGEKSLGQCSFLVAKEDGTFRCGIIEQELDPLKAEAAKILIHSGSGCTHKYGPKPAKLLRLAYHQGFNKDHPDWYNMQTKTIAEFQEFSADAPDPDQIKQALDDFLSEFKSLS